MNVIFYTTCHLEWGLISSLFPATQGLYLRDLVKRGPRGVQEGSKRGDVFCVACKNGLILMELAIGTSETDGVLLCADSFLGWERHCFLCVYRLCEIYCICTCGLAGIYYRHTNII